MPVVQFRPRRRQQTNPRLITKVIDGKAVECIDVDALSIGDRERYFSGDLFKPSRDGVSRDGR